MKKALTLAGLQALSKEEGDAKERFLLLCEAIGGLSKALGEKPETTPQALFDALLCATALATCCGVDLESALREKEALNRVKYGFEIVLKEDGPISLGYLQEYLRAKDYVAGAWKEYFIKLVEEVGELAQVVRTGVKWTQGHSIKGTLDEETCDVVYYLAAVVNCCGIALEQCAPEGICQ